MLDPEMLLFIGGVVVIVSVFLLVTAMHVRGWFFIPEPSVELQRATVRNNRR